MNFVERAKNIILQPKREWPIIATDPTTVQTLYTEYIGPLAGIAAAASFVGSSLIGTRVGGLGTYRAPLVAGLSSAVATFLLGLAAVYVVALIVDALAPSFSARKSRLAAVKLVGYSITPAWLGSILGILPGLGLLSLVASLYGLYLFYLGLPVLMQTPRDRAAAYTAVVFLAALVVGLVIGAVTGGLLATRSFM